MLEAWTSPKGEKPRLVHRLDRDTSGVLVVARTRGAAQKLTAAFRERDTHKTYWSLVRGVPASTRTRSRPGWSRSKPDGDRMRIAKHGEDGADHAISLYRVLETAAQNLAWLEMEPYTGRTHQLRVHAPHIGHPIIGDPKYFIEDPNWDFPGRRPEEAASACPPHRHSASERRPARVTAPLPPHMVQTWNLLGFDLASAEMDDE